MIGFPSDYISRYPYCYLIGFPGGYHSGYLYSYNIGFPSGYYGTNPNKYISGSSSVYSSGFTVVIQKFFLCVYQFKIPSFIQVFIPAVLNKRRRVKGSINAQRLLIKRPSKAMIMLKFPY